VRRYVIFSGANERAVIAVCRYLSSRGLAPVLIARSAGDPIWRTDYARLVHVTRQFDHIDVDDLLDCTRQLAVKTADTLVFLPTVESINRVVLAHRLEFELAGLSVEMVSQDVYTTLSDKASFIKLITEFDMSPPPEIRNPGVEDLPIVAKPFSEFSKVDRKRCYPELIFSEKEYRSFLKRTRPEDYFYQSYLTGHSFYYLMHISDEGELVAYQQNLIQQANGKSMLAARICNCPSASLERSLLAALKSVSYRGFVMIEVIQSDGVFYVIEANPRLWGPFELACSTPVVKGLTEQLEGKRLSHSVVSSPVKSCYIWLGGWASEFMRGHQVRIYPGAVFLLIKEFLRMRCADIFFRRDTIKLFLWEIREAISSRLTR